MRTLLPLLAFGALLLAAIPAAEAQTTGPQYSIIVSLVPPEDPFSPRQLSLDMAGKVEYVGDPSSALNLNGVYVEYHITKAPAWLSVTVSPSTDVIHLAQGQQYVGASVFTVSMMASEGGAPGSAADVVEITATVTPSMPFSYSKSAAAQAMVQYYAGENEECDEGHTVALTPLSAEPEPAAARPEEEPELTVQSGGVAPMGTWYAIAGFGLVGAGVGILLRRRFKA